MVDGGMDGRTDGHMCSTNKPYRRKDLSHRIEKARRWFSNIQISSKKTLAYYIITWTMMDSTSLISHVPESAFPVVTGCVAFGTTLALSTLAQKLVGISTGTKIVPTVAGMATVALASLASQQMAVYNHQYLQSQYYNPSKRPFLHSKHQRQPLLVATSGRRDYLEVASLKIPLDELRV
jgi:hypothetical protein